MSLRALFFEEDEARAVATRLVAGGFDAAVERARFAGEDDDEDQPWAVISDAPEAVFEIAVEEYGGWLEHPDPPPTPSPLDLPRGPLR